MLTGADELLDLLLAVFPDEPPPKPFNVVWARALVSNQGVEPPIAARRAKMLPRRLASVLEAEDFLTTSLGSHLPALESDLEARTRQSLGQLVIGNLAERAFEEIYRESIGTTELELKDDRGARGETDYLVFNGQGRQVFRINIKFHGALFRRAGELVGLDPEDCFALATYKIHAALNRQDAEHLPYLFVIVGIRGLTGLSVGESIPEDLVHLAALPRSLKTGGVRQFEDRIVDLLTVRPETFGLGSAIKTYFDQIKGADWYVLSARRADRLLRENLYDRVFALRVPRFTMNYRAAEVDMHFSLTQDLTPLTDFLSILRDHGMPGLVGRLERGTL